MVRKIDKMKKILVVLIITVILIGGLYIYNMGRRNRNYVMGPAGLRPLAGNLFSVTTDQGRILFFVNENLEVFAEEKLKQLAGCDDIYPKSTSVVITPSEAKQKVEEKLLEIYPSPEFDKEFCVSSCIQTVREVEEAKESAEEGEVVPETIAEKDCDEFCEIEKENYDWRYPLFSEAIIEEPRLDFAYDPISDPSPCYLRPWRYNVAVKLTDGRRSAFFANSETGEVWYSPPHATYPSIMTFDPQSRLSDVTDKLEGYLAQNNIQGTITESFSVRYIISEHIGG